MKSYVLAAAAVALALPATAHAEDFVIDITWGELQMTGGIGPNGNVATAGERDGTYVAKYADGHSVNGTIHCIGMSQPPSSIFPLHQSCDANSQSGHISLGLMCLWRGEMGPQTPLSCVGFMTGKEGSVAGRGGMITMDYTDSDHSHGTGQWWPAQQ